MNKPPVTWQGDGTPYLFICYAHADATAVYPLLEMLTQADLALWYDEGIAIGSEWTDSLAEAIEHCSHLLFLASPAAVASEHCRREINFAQSENKPIVTVHLEPVELPPGLKLSLNNRQAILKYNLQEEEFATRLLDALSDQELLSRQPIHPHSRLPNASRSLWLRYAPLLLTVIIATGLFFFTSSSEDKMADTTTTVNSDRLDNSIAVLPFENLSAAAADAYIADAMHHSVLHELAKVQELNVIARSTMQTYASSTAPLTEIAKALNVAYVLEGSVQLAEDRMRIQVSLVDPVNSSTLWTSTYEKPLADLLAVQGEIAKEITSAMKIELLDAELADIEKPYSRSAEAMVFFLKAQAMSDNLGPNMPPALYTFLDAAIAADPDMGIAHGLKSFALVLSLGLTVVDGMDLQAHKEAVLRHANIAIDSVEGRGYGHAAIAMVAEQSGEWARAEAAWRKATAVAPNNFDVLDDYARYMAFIGDTATVDAVLQRARLLNPADQQLEWGINIILGHMTKLPVDDPRLGILDRILVYTLTGESKTAVQMLASVAPQIPPIPLAIAKMCYLFGLNQQPDEAEVWCTKAENLALDAGPEPLIRYAHWLAALGRRDATAVVEALQAIERDELMGPLYFRHINNVFDDPIMQQEAVLRVRKRMGFRGKQPSPITPS